MIVAGDLATWAGRRAHRLPAYSHDELRSLLELLEEAARRLEVEELLAPTQLVLDDWVDAVSRAPSGEPELIVSVERGFAASVLPIVSARTSLPTTVSVHGRCRIIEPSGVDYVLEGILWLTATQSNSHLVWIKTSSDAWMPHDLLGAPQLERHRLNAPRLERALSAIDGDLGLQLCGTESKYAVVRDYGVSNKRFRDGDIIIPDQVSEASEGDYCTLLLDGCAVAIGRRVRTGAGDEVRSGYLTARPDARVLVTFTQEHAEEHDALQQRLSLPFRGIAPLRWLGPNEYNGVPYADVLIEDLPPGRPASDSMPVPEHQLLRIGVASANVLASVHAAGSLLGGVRPELVYVDDTGVFAAIAPRGPVFIANAPQRAPGLRSYPVPYDAPEVLALGKPAGVANDVFALCATLQHLATGRHPFGAEWPEILHRLAANAREPYVGSSQLAEILARGMDPSPERRPTAAELAALLAGLE